MAAFDDYADLQREIRSYLAAIPAEELEDPDAPSPLAYSELGRRGRTDIVEGCMKHGGYLRVSADLDVPVRVKEPPKKAEPLRFIAEPSGKGDLQMSRAAREERIAAQLAGPLPEAAAPSRGERVRAPSRTASEPLWSPSPAAAASVEIEFAAPSEQGGLMRFAQFDLAQRASLVLFVGASAGGFGRSSAELLAPETIATLQWGALVLLVVHVMVAAYGATLAKSGERGPAPLWFVKLLLTGLGGFAELRRELQS